MRDTIYRDDAIRVASGYCHPANIADELAKLPSAEKTGKWVVKPLWKGADASFVECDQCHTPAWWVSNYCPHCGAKMTQED